MKITTLLLIGALFTGFAYAADDCSYSAIGGKEFTFREEMVPTHAAYVAWRKEPDTSANVIAHDTYVGKKGKLQEQPLAKKGMASWYVATLESCEKLYTPAGFGNRTRTLSDIENLTEIYYTDTAHRAEALIGKRVWVNKNGVSKAIALVTDNPNTNYPLSHLETLEVSSLMLKTIGHARGAAPLFLVVKKTSGEQGYIAFNEHYIYLDDPIDQTWDKDVVELIKQQKVKIGMKETQAKLALGASERINKTVTANGVTEQWVYGIGDYVYLDNGVVVSFQTSR